jgi:hypothetical protein
MVYALKGDRPWPDIQAASRPKIESAIASLTGVTAATTTWQGQWPVK